MAPREAYIRAVRSAGKFETIVGLEWRNGDRLEETRSWIRTQMGWALQLCVGEDEMAHVATIEMLLKARWPDRAYFIEVGFDSDEGWVQVFQPYGLPRQSCEPGERIDYAHTAMGADLK